MAEESLPGVSIAVVDRDRILWSETFGVRDRDTAAPVTSETIFSIQSISKLVTATAIMIAVQDSLVELDVPITDYIPEFTVNSRFEDQPERKMTLRHLLSHTAGFTHEAPIGNNFDAASPSFEAHVVSISDTWLKFPVGERYSYSNLGFDLAAYVVQRVSGISFETFVQRRVFEPLGMRSSFIDTPTHNGNCDDCATGYNRAFTKLPRYIPIAASGGVRMSAEDGARFIQFHLNRGKVAGEQILRSDLLDEMYRQTAQDLSWNGTLWYGLGIMSWSDESTYVLNHNGGGFGYVASFRWYPEYGIGVALMINSVDVGESMNRDPGAALLDAILEQHLISKVDDPSIPSVDEFLAQIPKLARPEESGNRNSEITPYRPQWREYIGRYCRMNGDGYEKDPAFWRSTEHCDQIFSEDGYLLHTSGGGDPQRLIEHLPGLFFLERSGEAFDFRRNPPTVRNIELSKVE